ncbi:MAG: 2-alkenal reductase [Halobacteriovoraceae bacterium]|nr:2-alkenal reductase [Halobacteriovoraceae bacterium]
MQRRPMKVFIFALALATLTAAAAAPKSIQPVENELLAVEKRIIEIYRENVPAVVNVRSIAVQTNIFYGEEIEIPRGMGTGFVWDGEGHIVTNFHVVQGGDEFVITFHGDKGEYKAVVQGVDPKNDIALLKLEKRPKNLRYANIGKSKELVVGQMAMAIGNPLGFDYSLSRGIVSATGREMLGIGGVKIRNMIQTDAAINQGNSGGPLLDSSGRVIGMNTMIASRSGSSAGLGFAVPIDTISKAVPQLIEHGKIIRPGLGITVLDDPRVRDQYPKGAVLRWVDPDRGAGKAGLKGMRRGSFGRLYFGDVIISIDGNEVNTLDDIYFVLSKFKIGDTVTVEFLRDDKKQKAKVTLQEL